METHWNQKKPREPQGTPKIHSYTQEGESEEFLRSMSVQILLQQILFSEIPNFVGFSIDSSDY